VADLWCTLEASKGRTLGGGKEPWAEDIVETLGHLLAMERLPFCT